MAKIGITIAYIRNGYRRPRESGGPGATAAAWRPWIPAFRGNDEKGAQLMAEVLVDAAPAGT